ncbi:MAG: SAF domain-containing protein, partial [Acidobacteriaceae bacterium]
MNRRLLIILLSAFALAAGASYIVFLMVGRRMSMSHASTTSVIAAARNIKLGSILASADLTTIQIVGAAPKGAILKQSDAIGRGAVSD